MTVSPTLSAGRTTFDVNSIQGPVTAWFRWVSYPSAALDASAGASGFTFNHIEDGHVDSLKPTGLKGGKWAMRHGQLVPGGILGSRKLELAGPPVEQLLGVSED